MVLYLIDEDDSDSKDESDFLSVNGEDVDVYLNHYRIPKLSSGFGVKNGNNNGAGTSSSSSIGLGNREQIKYNNEGVITSLTELAAQKVACHLPFGHVERFQPPVPEPMQCRIAFWSFPQDEEDIRLYTCLANGSADIFIRAEALINLQCVCDMLQVGFHLSANVSKEYIQDSPDDLDHCRVAITFDRRRITSCSCSCLASTFWCEHTVAVCLQRIRNPQELTLRAPVSESLQRLEKNQLQKFAQYLINELPQQILPAAQKLLDELLSGDEANINQNPAAPDPTAGATVNEQTSWCLDDTHLSMDIHKILLKQCTTQPTVCSDIQALHTTAPPVATEYSQLLRPIKGREPEGLWNLISIVGEMMRRRDLNYLLLLEIMTKEVLKCDKVVTWWFETKVSLNSGSTLHYSSAKHNGNSAGVNGCVTGNGNQQQCTSQYSCSNLCDEIVHLWRLAAMDPNAKPNDRKKLYKKFFDWHLDILQRHSAEPDGNNNNNNPNNKSNNVNRKNLLELFPGFKSAIEGCLIDWFDWDEKKCCMKIPEENPDFGEVKSQKGKKKKRKSKTAKKNAALKTKASTTDELASISEANKPEEYQEPENRIRPDTPLPSRPENVSPDVQDEEHLQPSTSHDKEIPQDQTDKSEPQKAAGDQLQEAGQEEQEHNLPVEQDLRVYFMDKPPEVAPSKVSKPETLSDCIKVNPKRLNDPLEIIYAKTEGLHAHGHLEEARKLAVKAADEILNHPNYPSLRRLCTLPRRKKKKGTLDNPMSIAASEALTKVSFLCNVLLDDPTKHNLIFNLVLFGVEMKRSPAATKPLEVKLINQKQDLINLLKNIILHEEELTILREKAQAMRDGTSANSFDALTILILGNFMFEALVLSKSIVDQLRFVNLNCQQPRANVETSRSASNPSYIQPGYHSLEEHYLSANELGQQSNSYVCDRQACPLIVSGKNTSDSNLGFYAALEALSVKLNFPEVDHPLLCEGTRRQRGELALSMLIHYKDDQEKLDLILKSLLDIDVNVPPQVAPAATHAIPSGPENTKQSDQRPSKKNNQASQDSNQPTEASAHFMFELAKTVFDKAGGNSTTIQLFRPQLVAQNGSRGIYRRLHMCALRIAVHALGLQNKTSHNWMQRTYNGRASFIHEQALEIGLPAIKFLCENWVGYLTPVEAASTADKAGCFNDAETKRVAAEMAKSCLKYANYLEFNTVRRILAQCKEQSIEMIEEACNEIEQIAEAGNVCADVLFATAKAWYSLYDKLINAKNLTNGENVCCQMKDIHTNFYEMQQQQQYSGASNWLVAANAPTSILTQDIKCQQLIQYHYQHQQQQHQQQQQFNNIEPIHSKHWDFYGRADFIPTIYTPSPKYIDYVKSAYRVGLKALDALKPPVHSGNKHNPQKDEDILWLLQLSKTLGREHLHKFSCSAIKNIINPQTLHIICTDLINFFAALPVNHVDRLAILLPLIDKCLETYKTKLRDLMRHASYDQVNYIESILDIAQNLTYAASTRSAVGHFQDLLRTVEMKKSGKCRVHIDTKLRGQWIEDLSKDIMQCQCASCCAGGRVKY